VVSREIESLGGR